MQSEVHFKEAIGEYLGGLVENPNNIHTLEDIIEFNKNSPEEEYPSRNIDWWLASIRACKLPREELDRRLERMLRLSREGIIGTLEAHNLDVLAVASPSNCKVPVTFAARAGLPIITLPLGFYPPDTPTRMNGRCDLIERAPGMPFSIGFFGRPYSEETLIRIAYGFEQLTHARKKSQPFLLQKIDLRDIIKSG